MLRGLGERFVIFGESDFDGWCGGEGQLFYNRRRWKQRQE
jgi:hypothetical protein